MKGKIAAVIILAILVLIGMAEANGPEMMVYSGIIPQGVNEGDGDYEITFGIYPSKEAGEALWSETQRVYVYRGTFAVYLGAENRLDLPFDMPYWVGVKARGKEAIWPLMAAGCPTQPTVKTAATATTGIEPKAVLADEVLSANIKEADNLSGQNTNLGSGVKTGHITNSAVTEVKIAANAVTTVKIADGAVTNAKITGPISSAKIQQGATPLDSVIEALTARIAALETKLAKVTTSPNGRNIIITGANLHVRSGSGTTDGVVNGLGNIIIGYNEVRTGIGAVNTRTGSHNLVIGKQNNFSSFGGMVAGTVNTISGQFASVSGGRFNVASGASSSVAGGGGTTSASGNKAFADFSAVLGGENNKAGDPLLINHQLGQSSTVSGGSNNTASGLDSSVSGGTFNLASGTDSAVSGGTVNTASSDFSSVSGGDLNTASGQSSSVSGGTGNTASSLESSVSGGGFNTASGRASSVSGGDQHLASGLDSSVSGGSGNTASGQSSSVSGGNGRSAIGINDWQAGALFQDF